MILNSMTYIVLISGSCITRIRFGRIIYFRKKNEEKNETT